MVKGEESCASTTHVVSTQVVSSAFQGEDKHDAQQTNLRLNARSPLGLARVEVVAVNLELLEPSSPSVEQL